MKPPKSDAANSITRSSKIHLVPISLVRPAPVHVTQRPFRLHRGRYLAANLDLNKLGYPVVNHRDGIFWVLDGQHRFYSLRENGFENDSIDCEVYDGLTDEQCASIFLGRNNTLHVAPFDKFKIACTANDPKACAIQRAVESQGAKVSQSRDENCIGSVSALGKVYDLAGGGHVGEVVVGQTVRAIKNAFAGDAAAFDQHLIQGVGLVFIRNNGHTNERDLSARIGATPQGVRGILQRAEAQRARTGNQKAQCVAAAVVDIYNKGVGARGAKRLPSWWLQDASAK